MRCPQRKFCLIPKFISFAGSRTDLQSKLGSLLKLKYNQPISYLETAFGSIAISACLTYKSAKVAHH